MGSDTLDPDSGRVGEISEGNGGIVCVVVATDKMKEVFCGTLQMKYGFLWILWWNCLTAVPGDEFETGKQQEYSATIKKCASKLIGLIFNVLDLAD